MVTGVLAGVSAIVVAFVCTALVLHKDYEDGLVGRIGLTLVALASCARASQLLLAGFDHPVNPIGMLLWIGLALFMTRHAYRFMCWRRRGEHDWRDTDRTAACGKQ